LLPPPQVVELPRQKPDAALALFAGVASRLRILVVGGDGSVAWILSCLETLKEEQAARGNPRWKPPPVGVLPLGTGARHARRAQRAQRVQLSSVATDQAWAYSCTGLLRCTDQESNLAVKQP
jgi:diacylglycerol kinase family enzyme